MSAPQFQLAQVNIARMRGGLSSPIMQSMASRIDEMNQLAERSKGFVWRARGADVTGEMLLVFEGYVVPFEPERLFYNMSVWESLEDLRQYAFKSAHTEMLHERRQWMVDFDRASLAMWWIMPGQFPTVAESARRLRAVQERGPTSFAFTFAQSYPPTVTGNEGTP